MLEEEPQRAQNLQHNVEFFLNALHAEGVEAYSPTAIIPIIIGDEKSALQVADELLANGVLAPAIRYPTVAKVLRACALPSWQRIPKRSCRRQRS